MGLVGLVALRAVADFFLNIVGFALLLADRTGGFAVVGIDREALLHELGHFISQIQNEPSILSLFSWAYRLSFFSKLVISLNKPSCLSSVPNAEITPILASGFGCFFFTLPPFEVFFYHGGYLVYTGLSYNGLVVTRLVL